MALVNKAAILFHRAAHLTGQWSPSNSLFLFSSVRFTDIWFQLCLKGIE